MGATNFESGSTILDMQESLENILPEVCACAFAAGQEVLKLYQSTTEFSKKDDGSPVTMADIAANDMITKYLKYLLPNTPIVSEESIPENVNVKKDFWLVDPIDGTKSFINKTDEFSINIALIRKQKPVLGVIYIPVTDEIFAAVNLPKNHKALKGNGAMPLTPISTRVIPEKNPILLLGNKQTLIKDVEIFLEPYYPYKVVTCSSSIKFCRIAEGLADIYIRTNSLFEWDTAAGHAIVEAAGGSIKDWKNRTSIIYGKHKWVNEGFFVYGQ